MLAFKIHIFWLCTKKRIRFRWKQELLKLDKSLYQDTSRTHQNNTQTYVYFLWNPKNLIRLLLMWSDCIWNILKCKKDGFMIISITQTNVLNSSKLYKNLWLGELKNIYIYINIVCIVCIRKGYPQINLLFIYIISKDMIHL